MSFITSNPPSTIPGTVFSPSGFSTDNAITRWDGASGTVIQNSSVILDDSGNITGVASLTVTTLIATTTISTGDNLILLNDDVVGVPTENAGLEVERGTSTNAQFIWDEVLDRWSAGLVGSTSKVLLASDSTTDLAEGTNLYFTASRVIAALPVTTKGDILTYSTVPTRLPVGADGFALLADSSEPTGLKWVTPPIGYTDEMAQDAVGTILVDTATIDFSYNDGLPSISASVIQSGLDHGSIGGLSDDDHTQYHNDSRALTWLGTRSTTDLSEGTNLYYTQSRFDTAFGLKSTTNLTEGTNLYFTDARARAAITILDTSSVDLTYSAGQISAAVLPAGVDHNSLANLTVGDVHTQYVRKDTLTTKGDLYVRDASVPIRVGVGANAQVLTADSSTASGVKWASPTVASNAIAALFADSGGSISNKFLATENVAASDTLPSVMPNSGTLIKVTFSGTGLTPSGTLEFRINTNVGVAALSLALGGTQTQTFVTSLAVVAGDKVSCKVAAGASGISKPLVKIYY